MIPRLTAIQFHRFMSSGRTSPALCRCKGDAGSGLGDYVVKLRGGIDRGERGLLCELIGSQLATHFGISTPESALVSIVAGFAEEMALAEPSRADRLRNSVGLNFGSRLMPGMSGWPVDKTIPEGMWGAAVNIFAFDALIQNPDRRFNNQNLLVRGNDIFVYDHELAFSFLEAILPSGTPWKLMEQPYLSEHVFYRQLKKKPFDLSGFALALSGLLGRRLDSILAEAPAEWNNEVLGRIGQHLRLVNGHAEEFVEEIRRSLA